MSTSVHPIDVYVEHHGSIVLLRAYTEAATDWFEEHLINDESMFHGDALVAEPRYVPEIITGLREDGLFVRGGGVA